MSQSDALDYLILILHCLSVLQSKMEATFGPTFSAVASGSKGNNQEFFTSTFLHYVTIAESLLGIVMF